MPYQYNKSEEGNCKQCGKPLKDADKGFPTWSSMEGNYYGYRLYCSYRCVNDAQTKRAKERRHQAMKGLICHQCKKVFDGKRKDTKFCSIKCRVTNHRIKKGCVKTTHKKQQIKDN